MGTSAVEPSARTIDDEIGQMFGDFTGGEPETPSEAPTADAGAPPADAGSASTDPEPAAPGESADAAPPTGEPAADAPPVDGAAPTTEPDPLESATPLAYTVNGQSRTYDGIRVLGEHGAVIQAKDLPGVIQRLSERDHYYEANQRQYLESKALEPLQTWTVTGQDGKGQTLTGQQALIAMHVDHARKDALIAVMDQVLGDPGAIVSLLAQDKDGNVIIDAGALEQLHREIRLSAGERATQVRSQLSERVAEASRPAPAPIDYAAETPLLVRSILPQDHGKLTAEDIKFLAAQLPAYTNGKTVHASFSELVKDRLAMRVALSAQKPAATDPNKVNAARLAAAARGVPPKKSAAPPARSKAPTPESTRVSDADQAWALRERLSAGRFSSSQ